MHRYTAVKNKRPHKAQCNITKGATKVLRDEEEIMKDAKNKLRLVLSNGSAPVFPISGSDGKRYVVPPRLRYLFQVVQTQTMPAYCRILPTLDHYV